MTLKTQQYYHIIRVKTLLPPLFMSWTVLSILKCDKSNKPIIIIQSFPFNIFEPYKLNYINLSRQSYISFEMMRFINSYQQYIKETLSNYIYFMQPQQIEKKNKFQALHQNLPVEMKENWEKQQARIREKIVYQDKHIWNQETLRLVCGVDLSANKEEPDLACVGLVVYDLKSHQIVYQDYQIIHISQPYIPGFLAFRQVPPLYALFMKLKIKSPEFWPQLIMVDGNGILHQNQCGLASHLGVLLDIPTLGVGKTLFYIDGLAKDKVKQLCQDKIQKQNDFVFLTGDSGRTWGAALRNGANAQNPVFVSIGTKISLQTAIQCVIRSSKYRVPEPIRLADKKSRELIQKLDLKADKSIFKKYQMIKLQDI